MNSISFSFLDRISRIGFGFLNFLILVRVLDPTKFGVWVLFFSVITVIEFAREGIIKQPLVYYYVVEQHNPKENLLTSSFSVNLLVALGASIICVVMGFISPIVWGDEILSMLFWCYIPVLWFNSFSLHVEGVMNAEHNFKLICIAFTCQNLVMLGYLSSSFFLGKDLALYEVLLALGMGASVRMVLLFTLKNKLFVFKKPNKQWMADLFNYGKFTFGINVSSQLLQMIDQLMLGAIISPANVSYFNIGKRLKNLSDIPITAVAQSAFPKFSKANTEGKSILRKVYIESLGLIYLLNIPGFIILFLFAEEIITLIAGEEYVSATTIFRILVVTMLISPVNRLSGVVANALKKPKTNFIMVFVAAGINISLNAIFIYLYQAEGAALATLMTQLGIFFFWVIWIRKNLKLDTDKSLVDFAKTHLNSLHKAEH
ncbi:flippase [Limibacter armeniacum]|uniref:flippase n=1 Tax=Limibacter armeniacum TaxID=466084 RepID=UPI002FE58184